MTDKLTPCAHCGQLVPADELWLATMNDGTTEQWCRECIETDTTYCDRCGEYRPGEAVAVYSAAHIEGWCEHCADTHAVECDCCHDLTDDNDMHHIYVYHIGWQSVCTSCLEENYYQCCRCGNYCLEDDVEYHNGDYYCPACAPSVYFSDYHHTDAKTFLHTGNDSNQPYLGVELELEFPTSDLRANAAKRIRCHTDYGDYYDCKEDGSLGEYGMEVVTQPATPAYHMTGYNDVMLSAGKDCGATSHDNGNCGLHVHIDRDYFTETGIQYAADRAGYIMDTIFSNNEAAIVNFTRRRYSQLNHWAQLMHMCVCKSERSLNSKLMEYRSSKYTRYQAVNMENVDTIELRLFRGTLNPTTYYATLEFVAALAYVTRALLPIPEYAETLTWADLKTELFAALKLMNIPSGSLAAYLNQRGL